MAKCPVCGVKINHLNVRVVNVDYFRYDGDWHYVDTIEHEMEFQCPICDETLFTNEEEARKFLKT